MVKSCELENLYSLLFILLKSCLCWYSLRSGYFPPSKFESHLGHGSTMQGVGEWSWDETSRAWGDFGDYSLFTSRFWETKPLHLNNLSLVLQEKKNILLAQTYAPYIHKNSSTAVAMIKQHSFTLLSISA